MDFALTVAYRGGGYAGWQRQSNALAIQQVLEEALAELTGESVRTLGSGRTDQGVHARHQVVSLRLSRNWPRSALVKGTNRFLPEEIRVMDARIAIPGFSARRDARSKEYRYRLRRTEVLSPLESWNTVRVAADLDMALLERAAKSLCGSHDFSAFAKAGGSHRGSVRQILEARWLVDGTLLTFAIVGDGFLRGMVRALVGTLLEVGDGRRPLTSFLDLLEGGRRPEAGPNAPAHGLVLHAVDYPSTCFVEV